MTQSLPCNICNLKSLQSLSSCGFKEDTLTADYHKARNTAEETPADVLDNNGSFPRKLSPAGQVHELHSDLWEELCDADLANGFLESY